MKRKEFLKYTLIGIAGAGVIVIGLRILWHLIELYATLKGLM